MAKRTSKTAAKGGPKRKIDKMGRNVPTRRKPGAGRPKSTPLRQHLANMEPRYRTDPPAEIAANAPLSGDPPADLGEYGRFLWQLLVAQQADAAAKGIAPAVGMESFALAEQYCSAFDRWAEVKETIKHLEAERPAADRHLAKWRVDDDGKWTLHGVWQTEARFRTAAVDAARALGIGASHPTTALQVNINGQQVAADPTLALIGPYRESARIVDAAAEGG